MLAPKHHAYLSGFLLTGAPASWVLLDFATHAQADYHWLAPVALALQALVGVSLGLAGWLLASRPRLGRWLAGAGLITALVSAGPFLLDRPGAALATGAALILLAAVLVPRRSLGPRLDDLEIAHREASPPWRQHDAIQGSLTLAAALLFVLLVSDDPPTIGGWVAAWLTAGTAYLLATGPQRERSRLRIWWILGQGAVLLAAAGLGPNHPRLAMLVLLVWPLARQLQLRLLARSAGMAESQIWDLVTTHPARLMVTTFLLAGLIGGAVLWLPAAHAHGKGIPFVDASFTAFSAVCVTGLVVVDTPTAYSGFGQFVILLLIQLGGLGIMTFATLALHLAGRRVGLAQESAMAALLGKDSRAEVYDAARAIFRVTVAVELAGALCLALGFLSTGDPLGTAAWRGLFTSVSAYCNAGFALQTTSLVPYQDNGFILITTSLLIIIGGLGPLLVTAIPGWVRKRPTALVTKVGVATTGILLVIAFAVIASAEWSGGLSHLSVGDRLTNAWFQAVTLRTAGFNSIDFSSLHSATITVMLAMMFIGGCPGSTAGGIKTTTAAIMILTVAASLRGRITPRVFGRRVGIATLVRAAAIVSLAVLSIVIGVVLLGLTQSIPWQSTVFEVVSATGTVGLSLGATPALDGVGKVVIMACMFAGRVGPLTLFMLVGGDAGIRRWKAPTEELAVG